MRIVTVALIVLSNISFGSGVVMAATPRVITPVPAVVSSAIADCLKQFQSRDVKEQSTIIRFRLEGAERSLPNAASGHECFDHKPERSSAKLPDKPHREKYAKNAIFADPIMKVKGTTNVQLQFYSLIKIFSSVVIEEKELTVTEGPKANTYKADLENLQTYVSRREGFFSRHLMPKEIKINVRTTLIVDKDSGLIQQQLEKWHDKKAPIPGFMRPFNGWFSAHLFKIMGWGKDIKASAGTSKTATD